MVCDIRGGVRKALSLSAVIAVAALAHMLVMAGTATPSSDVTATGTTTICHNDGSPAGKTIGVDSSAVPAHLDHGDTLGACVHVPTTTTPPTTSPTTTAPTSSPTTTSPTTTAPTSPETLPTVAGFTVGITFSDAKPVGVPVTLSCTSGAVTIDDGTGSEGNPASFTVIGFAAAGTTTCTATQTAVPDGYTSSETCTATVATGACTITNTAGVVEGASVVRTDSSVVQRALVAGETVHVAGTAPDGCRPVLRVDGDVISGVAVGPGGTFDVGVATDELSAGRHVAEVVCSSSGVLVSKTFWIAAPLTSSDVLSVGMLSMFTLGALGWVGIRTLRDSAGVDAA